MKKKDLQEWRKKSVSEIKKAINEERKKLAGLDLDLAGGKVKNIREIRNTKKTIAQLLTLEKGLKNQ